ncbi:adenine-specific methyltransferase EcoRI family protein [Micrococcus yunnanensis]|uniref:adenine-specific methyltransferase EcoRI family protein n=1 Tax=Micrococcus yunnanensis TaxID=566027 RepID=UPI00300E4D50
MANANLGAARRAKQDEFYTQWADIEREMNAYLDYDPNVFRGKTILLPCDDPEWSNFTKFFAHHFTEYGLKKVISTSYAPNSNSGGEFYAPTLFELEGANYVPEKSKAYGRMFTLTEDDVNGDGKIDIDDLRWEYLEGDGDFRSPEVTALRDEADMVITNPPFSLFLEFLPWVIEGGVQFSIIGNSNAVTSKELFSLLKGAEVWKGATGNSTDMVFRVPETIEIKESDRKKAEKLGYKGSYTRLGNSCWFTNIEHGRRHEPLQLMTMEENRAFSRRAAIREDGYPEFDFYDAIEVGFTEAIPSDYEGAMGVPISFLDRFNPDQFEILDANDYRREGFNKVKPHGLIKDGDSAIDGKPKYARLVIRHRNPVKKEA